MLSKFEKAIKGRKSDPRGRRWLFVPPDQLSGELGALGREDPRSLGIVLVDNRWAAARRPYHKQKLALVLANLRHFVLEQADRGVAVRYRVADGPYHQVLRDEIEELGPLQMMEAAERELRTDLAPLIESGGIEVIPHEGWLSTDEDFAQSCLRRRTWRMDAFYRRVRTRTGILMENDKPVGGRLSFDVENRKPWRGEPPPATPPRFEPDAITREVAEEVERRFAGHPGRIDLAALPATRDDAERLWKWAKQKALPHFGPYEDAMSRQSTTLFHTRISSLLNLHRLVPKRILEDALALDLPLASREGFVRQVLGWREFVRHVHRHTDGFREFPDGTRPDVAATPGDAGYGKWRGGPWRKESGDDGPEGGALPATLRANDPLPAAFWGTPSGLACLDEVVRNVWDEGYGHHITRLMVLANLATLLDVSPRELTDWFWVAYTDAYDWAVEPNVLGMGTYAVGDLMTTKPYVSGAAYIDRMSDYCGSCTFDPKRTCPITHLYWAFLQRHRGRLSRNPRLGLPYRNLEKRATDKRQRDQEVFETVREALQAGRGVTPEDMSASPKNSSQRKTSAQKPTGRSRSRQPRRTKR